MSSSLNVKKRKPDEQAPTEKNPAGKGKKVKKRVRIGETETLGFASGEYQGEVDDTEDLETGNYMLSNVL